VVRVELIYEYIFDEDGDGYYEYIFIDKGMLYLYDNNNPELFSARKDFEKSGWVINS
jgi:hypothetical protein